MEILAIILGRGGSKGIPMKNIQKLAGKPLIVHTISEAKKSKLISKIIVSTDNKKIAKIVQKAGAEVPFIRPKKISHDSSTTIDVVKHAINYLEKKQHYKPDIITLLQPTSPFRTAKIIDRSITMLKNSKSDIVLGVQKIKTHPYRAFWLKGNYLKPFYQDFLKYHQRQLFPTLYYPTGSIYTFWTKTVKKFGHMYGPKIKPLIIENEEYNIDINSIFDLFISEMVLSNWLFYKKKVSTKNIS